MKRVFQIAALALVMVMGSSLRNKASAQFSASVTYQNFYDDLSPYGRWIDYDDYGYVWVPDAGPDFRPYMTNGHWVWSDDYDWVWVSDYDWGWAPFHYGRWFEDPYYGWVWVPGYEWSGGWVAWRDGGDYYGWAPLRPGINISINFSIGSYNPPYDYWCFAPRRYITSPRIYDYCFDRSRNVTIINQTTIINNYSYNRNIFRSGPSRFEAERYTGRINPVRFRESNRPGRTEFRNNEVSIYRPSVRQDNQRQFAPQRFERANTQANSGRLERRDNNAGRIDQTNNNRFERRNENTDNRIDRNDTRRNTDVNRQDNNLPRRMDNPNNRFERRTTDQPTNNDSRRFEPRTNNGNGNNERVFRQPERQVPQPQQGNNDNSRRFEPRTQPENRPQMQQRQFQQRSEQPQMQQRQFQQRSEQPQMRQRQFQQRSEQPQRQQPQVQQRTEQPQRFEPRSESPRQESNGNGNGRGNGRRRN